MPMSEETINTATIKVVADTSEVEVGMRRINESAARTGRSLENLGRSDGLTSLGDGAATAANKFAFGSKGIIEQVQKKTLAMELGKKGTVEYYAALGNQKGINPAILKPYLDQLDAVTRKTAEASRAQQKADDGAKFVEGLRTRAAELGKSASELASMRAAQLGVSESAGPFIERLRAAEDAAGSFGGSLEITTETLASFAAGLVGAVSVGAFVAGITSAISTLADLDDMAQKTGSSVESLSRLQKVAQMTGQDFGAVDTAVSKLAKGMGGLDEDSNKVISALNRLGISTKDIAKQDPSKVLIQASMNLQKYADGAGKTALANDLLGKTGADLLPFLNDVSENVGKFAGTSGDAAASASAFGDNMGALRVRVSELGTVVATNLLPYLVKFSEFIKDLAESKKFQDFVVQAGAAVSTFASFVAQASAVVEPAAKIAGAYFVAFVAAPAIIGAATTAMAALYGAARTVSLALLIGGTSAISFNTALFGTAVAANAAAGGLFTIKTALAGLFAAFAGFQIGKYLNDNFVQARVAGLAFVGAMLTGWENVKYGALMAWESIGFAWDKTIGVMREAFGNYLSVVARGLNAVGAKGAAAEVSVYAEALRAAGQSVQSFVVRTAGLKAAHTAELAAIDSNVTALVRYELGLGKVAAAAKKVAKPPPLPPPPPPLAGGKGDADDKKKQVSSYEDLIKVQAEYAKGLAKTVEDANAEAAATLELVKTFGMSKTAIAELNIVRMEERLERLRAIDMADDEVAALELVIAAKKRALGGMVTLDGMTDGKKALEDLDKFLDPSRAKDFGDALTDAFGTAGSALGKLANTLETYGKRQAEIEKQRGNAKTALKSGGLDEIGYAKRINELNAINTKNQLGSYGQMTSAAAGFFNEQSKGYKALQAASQVFHAAELAMTLAELVPKGISAVLGQGQGDPYSAFARMAAMAAIVAGLGVAVSGGSSSAGPSAADVQKTQGTGSVFGDSSAKSESISKSLERIESNTYQGLDYSAGMLSALRNIEASMGGLANLIVRTTGVADGSNFGIETGQLNIGKPTDAISSIATTLTKALFGPGLGGKIAGFINNLWGKTTQNISDSGIMFGGSVNDLQSGQGYQQYANVSTTKSSWFGLSKKTSNSVQTQGLGGELSNQFGMIFSGLEETLKIAAVGMGIGADQVTRSLDSLVLKSTTLSLKDLKGDELTAAINGVISKAMDDISAAAFPSFEQFRKIGEGYAETVIRVATNFQAINVIFESFGKVFGRVGVESVAARERLIELSGGLDNFTKQGEYFLSNFFSEQEQAAALKKRIQPTLSQFGLSTDGPDATKVFRDFVVALDTTSEAGAKAYTALQAIAPAFIDIVKASQAALDERNSLQDQLDELTMTSTQLLTKQRNAIIESNRALFDQVRAATAAKAAQDAAKASLGDVISRMKTFGESAMALRNGLMIGGLSTLTPEQQYEETRRQYQSTLTAAKGGDAAAQSNFSSIATTFLTASQKINGGDSQYSSDFDGVIQMSDEIAKWSAGQIDVAQASLDALNKQVIGIADLNLSILDMVRAVEMLPTALVTAPQMPNYSAMGTVSMEPLVAEIKALREQVVVLTTNAKTQTGDIITSNAQVAAKSTAGIVDGVGAAVKPRASASNSTAVLA